MRSRAGRIVVAGYLIKSLIVAAAWLLVPDLPERALSQLRSAWASVSQGPAR